MSESGHDLRALFPAQREILHTLKCESEHYRRLTLRYHAIALEIARIEEELDTELEARLEALKKQRLALLDEIADMIAEKQGA